MARTSVLFTQKAPIDFYRRKSRLSDKDVLPLLELADDHPERRAGSRDAD
jgi:hypothetical protein